MEYPMMLVLGESLIDVFAGEPTTTGLALDARVGGSPFNVAIGLARLGRPVAFGSCISSDRFGDRLMQALREEDVDVSLVQRHISPTTLSVVSADAHGVPSYAFHGDHAADRQLDPRPLERLPRAVRVLQLGSYPLVVEPVASTLKLLVQREHEYRLVTYDPNVRLNVEPAVLRWRAAVEWMTQRAHLVKISDEDAALLYPEEPPEALARRWLAQNVRLVVVTHGAQGCSAWTQGAHVRVAAEPVVTVDTVGAGDSFQAALLTWLAEEDRLEPRALELLEPGDLGNALRFASRAAAITCSRRGADLPRRAEV